MSETVHNFKVGDKVSFTKSAVQHLLRGLEEVHTITALDGQERLMLDGDTGQEGWGIHYSWLQLSEEEEGKMPMEDMTKVVQEALEIEDRDPVFPLDTTAPVSDSSPIEEDRDLSTKPTIKIVSRFDSSEVLYQGEHGTLKEAVEAAVKQKVNLCEADLEGSNLEGADLKGANLGKAYLKGSYLKGANFKGANLYRADFERADLEGVNFEGADLGGADLGGADLEGSNLAGVNFEWVNKENTEKKPIENTVNTEGIFGPAFALKEEVRCLKTGLQGTVVDTHFDHTISRWSYMIMSPGFGQSWHCETNLLPSEVRQEKSQSVFTTEGKGESMFKKTLKIGKFAAKMSAVMLVGYTLGFTARDNDVGPNPSTLWALAKAPITGEFWDSGWETVRIGATGNTDLIPMVNGEVTEDLTDPRVQWFDPETNSFVSESKLVRTYSGLFGNVLREETKDIPPVNIETNMTIPANHKF